MSGRFNNGEDNVTNFVYKLHTTVNSEVRTMPGLMRWLDGLLTACHRDTRPRRSSTGREWPFEIIHPLYSHASHRPACLRSPRIFLFVSKMRPPAARRGACTARRGACTFSCPPARLSTEEASLPDQDLVLVQAGVLAVGRSVGRRLVVGRGLRVSELNLKWTGG